MTRRFVDFETDDGYVPNSVRLREQMIRNRRRDHRNMTLTAVVTSGAFVGMLVGRLL